MLMDVQQATFIDMLIGSILISLSGFGLWWLGRDPYTWALSFCAQLFAFGWFLLFVHTVGRFGKRGLWLLPGGIPVLWVSFDWLATLSRCVFVGGGGCGVP